MRKLPLLYLLLFGAIGSARAAERTLTNKEYGFEIIIPDSWELVSETIPVARREPKEGATEGAWVQVCIRIEKEPTTLEVYAREDIKSVTRWTEMKVTEEAAVKVNGIDMYRVRYEAPAAKAGEPSGVRVTWYFLKGKHRFMINTSSTGENYDKFYSKDLEAIVKTFKLTKAK